MSTVIKRIVEEDRSKLTIDVGKSNWKEAVVYTLSYSEKNSKQLIEELGDELHKKKDINSAIICYLISEQVEKVAQLWKLRVEASIRKHPDCKEQVLNNFLQKVTYLRMATGSQAVVDDISDLVADFCEILAEQGEPALAMKYLQLHHYSSDKATVLAHRIYHSVGPNNFDSSVYAPQSPHPNLRLPRPQRQR